MRCIFCKEPSHASKSVEHIIPESLGNTRHVLPKGIVCDSCNNYFAREVEGPILNHPMLRNHRAWNGIRTKKGKLPSFIGHDAVSGLAINMRLRGDGEPQVGVERASDWEPLFDAWTAEETAPAFVFDLEAKSPSKMMSRFLAKIAFERIYQDLKRAGEPALVDHLMNDSHWERLRRWARHGDCYDEWPFSDRRVYPDGTLMRHPDTGEWTKAGLSMRLFHNRLPETFFALGIHGREFVINVGGASIKGYELWLEEKAHISPLVEDVGLRVFSGFHEGRRATFIDVVEIYT